MEYFFSQIYCIIIKNKSPYTLLPKKKKKESKVRLATAKNNWLCMRFFQSEKNIKYHYIFRNFEEFIDTISQINGCFDSCTSEREDLAHQCQVNQLNGTISVLLQRGISLAFHFACTHFLYLKIIADSIVQIIVNTIHRTYKYRTLFSETLCFTAPIKIKPLSIYICRLSSQISKSHDFSLHLIAI